jgi:adenosylmethionine-8-amino-7-oxononanoate aminotransferase
MGYPMSTPSMISNNDATPVASGNAAEHLWMHFTRMSSFADKPVPTIERGEGAYIWDTNGRKYLDAYQPDIITSAKGLTSGYSPLDAAIISDRIFEPFAQGTTAFPHGYTFGGHPVSCAVGLANLDLFEREDLLGNVLRQENALRRTLEQILRHVLTNAWTKI